MIYLELFLVYLKIGFFGFGGGYAMLSLLHNEVVVAHTWLTVAELTDIIAISQMTPGPIAINSATYVGYVVTGSVWGSVVATLAVCLPALTVMLILTRFYLRHGDSRLLKRAMWGMQPMVIAMIGAAALMLFTPETFIDPWSWVIVVAAFAATVLKVNPIFLIVGSGVAGWLIYGVLG